MLIGSYPQKLSILSKMLKVSVFTHTLPPKTAALHPSTEKTALN